MRNAWLFLSCFIVEYGSTVLTVSSTVSKLDHIYIYELDLLKITNSKHCPCIDIPVLVWNQ